MAAKDLQMPNEGLKTGLRRYNDEVMMPLMNAKSLRACLKTHQFFASRAIISRIMAK
jgi:hypothetical protein